MGAGPAVTGSPLPPRRGQTSRLASLPIVIAMVKTPHIKPSSPLIRILYDPDITPREGVLTLAHVGIGLGHEAANLCSLLGFGHYAGILAHEEETRQLLDVKRNRRCTSCIPTSSE